jgi:deazaflavin-dependent oxidoreductase (nitroreductase family)
VSFTTPDGTYGITARSNRLMRGFIARQVKGIRKGREKMMGITALVLVTVGRKSGRTLETPVAYWTLPDGSWIVCASAAGATKHPHWYRNIAAHPDLTAVIAGREIPVHAEELHGDARDAAWTTIVKSVPRFASYTKKTDRELPVIRLTERAH